MIDLLTEVWDDGHKLAAYEYNADGTVRRETHGPVRREFRYDADRNLTGLLVRSGESLLSQTSYTYDGNGNRTLKRQGGGDTLYHYDRLNRLQKVDYPTYTEELFYDRAGNRTRRVAGGEEELYQYDPRNRLMALTRGGVTTRFRYDNAGNLLQDDNARYSYDAFNRTTRVETFDGNVQVNRYDAEGLRYEMEENGRLVRFIFNQNREVISEEDGDGIARLIRGTELVARSGCDAARTYYHYVSDEMGSTTHIVDEAGQVCNRYEYDAWGNITFEEETVPNRFTYYGQQLDPFTRQYYLRARFYNPVIGRFTQEDTYRGDGLNLYAYCANNPVFYVDPSGHKYKCANKDAQKKMRPEVPTEITYRKAHADLLRQKLNDPNLSPAERARIEDKLKKTTDMSRISDKTLIEAAKSIHDAEYNNSEKPMPGYGARNPVSVTIGSDGRVAVTKNNYIISPKSRERAQLIFGDDVIIPGGYGVQYDNKKNRIETEAPKHAEARGYQALLAKGDESSLAGARQATTLPSCGACQDLREGWNEYFKETGQSPIINLTGDRSRSSSKS